MGRTDRDCVGKVENLVFSFRRTRDGRPARRVGGGGRSLPLPGQGCVGASETPFRGRVSDATQWSRMVIASEHSAAWRPVGS